jgi:hypothetical protein
MPVAASNMNEATTWRHPTMNEAGMKALLLRYCFG